MGGIVKWVEDRVEDVGNSLEEGAKAVGDFVEDTVNIVSDVIKKGVDFAVDAASNPAKFLSNPMQLISLAVATVMAPVTGGTSLYLYWGTYYAVASGMVTEAVVSMAKQGWIAEEHIAIVSIIANLAAMKYGIADNATALRGGAYYDTYKALTNLGVSPETSLIIADYARQIEEIGMYLNSGYVKLAQTAYSIYEEYKQYLKMEAEWKSALAAFEAWKKNFQDSLNRQESKDQEIADFVSGAYYRKLAGQPMFNVNLAGHERYVAVDVQRPSWGLDTNPAYNVEPELAKLMWYDKQFDMAGGSSFTPMQIGIPKFV